MTIVDPRDNDNSMLVCQLEGHQRRCRRHLGPRIDMHHRQQPCKGRRLHAAENQADRQTVADLTHIS